MPRPTTHAPILPRWQRMLLPGELRGSVDERRSARDWVVDRTLFAVAAGLSALVLVATWADHGGLAIAVDFALGVVAFVAAVVAPAPPGRGRGHRRRRVARVRHGRRAALVGPLQRRDPGLTPCDPRPIAPR